METLHEYPSDDEFPEDNTLPGELHQIQAYVDATNTHIHHLSSLVEPSAAEQIAQIKRGLKDAHRGLEKLEEQFAAVSDITREVWGTYRRLRELEEKLHRGEDLSIRRDDAKVVSGGRVVRAVPAIETASVASALEGESAKVYDADADEGEEEDEMGLEGSEYLTPRGHITPRLIPSEEWSDTVVLPPKRVPIHIPTGAEVIDMRHHKPIVVEGHRRGKSDPLVRSRKVEFPKVLAKTRREVIASIAEEESLPRNGIYEPGRKREGSADGWLISLAVMTANDDPRVCVPHLAYIKIHEVRDLKVWLQDHRYLRRSRGISKIEKVLHLLTVLQVGCRFESVAVLFSRTPLEVLHACREVFEGLLELHSETMLPGPGHMENYLYPHLWHIMGVYSAMKRSNNAAERVYYPWKKDDLCKVLVTLNLYIGRYRSQGELALDGPILDWGKYIDVDHEEQEPPSDVPRWIERLQTAPPQMPTRQGAIVRKPSREPQVSDTREEQLRATWPGGVKSSMLRHKSSQYLSGG